MSGPVDDVFERPVKHYDLDAAEKRHVLALDRGPAMEWRGARWRTRGATGAFLAPRVLARLAAMGLGSFKRGRIGPEMVITKAGRDIARELKRREKCSQ